MKKLINKPYNIEILKLCNGNFSISDISRIVGLTYKSIFYRLEELISEGIIEKTSGAIGVASKMKVKENFKNEVESEIHIYELNQKIINNIKEDPELKKIIKKMFEKILEKRYIEKNDLMDMILEEDPKMIANISIVLIALESHGFVKSKTELTKKGKSFIKKL